MSTDALTPGETIAGCRVDGRIGGGVLGEVYLALHEFSQRRVAVKVLPADRVLAERLTAAAARSARLRHPNIAEIVDHTVGHERHILVTAFVAGASLSRTVAADGPLPPVRAARLFLQIARALGAGWVHGLAHGDVRPANVIVTHGGVAKLIDYGVMLGFEPEARLAACAPHDRVYLSPEVKAGARPDLGSDLFALGISLFTALVGRAPLPHEMPAIAGDAPIEIPDALQGLIWRLADDDPARRPTSVSEVTEVLEAYLNAAEPGPWALVAEPDMRRADRLIRLCESRGISPVWVTDGDDGLAVLETRREPPEVLITTLVLPGADGFALLRALRQRAGAEARAMVFTHFAALQDAAMAHADALGIKCMTGPIATDAWLEDAIDRIRSRAQAPRIEPAAALDPTVEAARQARVAAMGVVDDAPPDDTLQALVAQAAEVMRVPMALISLVLGDRQWFKAYTGLEGALLAERGGPAHESFCRHVMHSDRALIINDAQAHLYFGKNRLVQAGGVGSYAGAPVTSPQGQVLATLCVVDGHARQMGDAEVSALIVLARRVAGELQLRAPTALQRADTYTLLGAARFHALADVSDEALADARVACLVMDGAGQVVRANAVAEAMLGVGPGELVGMARDACLDRLGALHDNDHIARVARVPHEGPYAAHGDLYLGRSGDSLAWSAWPVRLDDGVVQFETFRRHAAAEPAARPHAG